MYHIRLLNFLTPCRPHPHNMIRIILVRRLLPNLMFRRIYPTHILPRSPQGPLRSVLCILQGDHCRLLADSHNHRPTVRPQHRRRRHPPVRTQVRIDQPNPFRTRILHNRRRILSPGSLRVKMYHRRQVRSLLYPPVPLVRCRFLAPRDQSICQLGRARTRANSLPRALQSAPSLHRACLLLINGSLSLCQPRDRSSCRYGNARCPSPESPRPWALHRLLRCSPYLSGEAPCLAEHVLCLLPAGRLVRLAFRKTDSHVLPRSLRLYSCRMRRHHLKQASLPSLRHPHHCL